MFGRLTIRAVIFFGSAILVLTLVIAAAAVFFHGNETAVPAAGAMARQAWVILIGLNAAFVVLALWLTHRLAARSTAFQAGWRAATEAMASGKPGRFMETGNGIAELDTLAAAFNATSAKLEQRERNLFAEHARMDELNKNYVNLIGYLSHEVKGLLATSVMNVCSVRDQYFGTLNEKQIRALDGAARSLDYLTVTVRIFLNLGKIEKGELKLNRRESLLREDIIDNTVKVLSPAATRKGMQIHNNVGAGQRVNLDPELMYVVVCNLVSNAIKYGNEGGSIIVSSGQHDGRVSVTVYNDSTPLTADQQAKLFKRFSRLDTPATRNVKGTGLGLFIAREIVRLHRGTIRTEAKEQGNAFIFDIPK